MKRNEYKSLISELLTLSTPDNQGRVSEILTQLTEDYETVLTTSEGYENRVAELSANNETLRKVNADLFLKVGTQLPGSGDSDTGADETETEIPTFESLFNDKGELI